MLFGKKKKQVIKTSDHIVPWFDLHCHFLPEMDDGCKNVKETLNVLAVCHENGIEGMIATPHYYPRESIDNFLARRKAAEEKVQAAVREHSIMVPKWCLGAEVSYHAGLARNPELEKLCMGKSDFLLLELPFEKWGPSVIRDVHEIINVRGITPIIAHLERYLSMQEKNVIKDLYETGAMIQMNAEYILDSRDFKKAGKRISSGKVDILGSDLHNMRDRKPNLRDAVNKLEVSGFGDNTNDIRRNNKTVFYHAMGW